MLLILAFSLVIASVFLIIYRKNKDSILWLGLCTSLMLELCGVMHFYCKKRWHFTGSINISVFFKKHISEDAVFPDHIRSAGISDCHRQVSVSVFFAEDCNELFNASGT